MPVFVTVSRIEKTGVTSPDVWIRRWHKRTDTLTKLIGGQTLRMTHEGVAAANLVNKKEIEEFRLNPPVRLELVDRTKPRGTFA